MVDFNLWAHVECRGPQRYVARVCAIPCGGASRCAPETLAAECSSDAEARKAAASLLEKLSRELHTRGHRAFPQSN